MFARNFVTFPFFMRQFVRRYMFSWLLIAVILFLSFFKVPETELSDVPFIDKWTHIAMYFTLCSAIWIEYLRSHHAICYRRLVTGAIVLPCVMGGVIELLQAYCTTNRSGDWLDFAANSLGVLLTAVLGFTLYRKWFFHKKL